jgi:hypothetical protein
MLAQTLMAIIAQRCFGIALPPCLLDRFFGYGRHGQLLFLKVALALHDGPLCGVFRAAHPGLGLSD